MKESKQVNWWKGFHKQQNRPPVAVPKGFISTQADRIEYLEKLCARAADALKAARYDPAFKWNDADQLLAELRKAGE